MTILKKLTPELELALGKRYDFISHYGKLLEKVQSSSLRDDQEAISYMDEVIKRYKLIKATSPKDSKLQKTKDSYLPLLKQHALELGLLAFSKPNDLVPRLQELDFDPDAIDEIARGIEQAGWIGGFAASIITSASVITSFDDDRRHNNNHHHHGRHRG